MKRFLLTVLLALATTAGPAFAANTSTTVDQVTTAVVLSTDVDYHITSTTPFSDTGSIDITNTDHAVIIFDNLKPSLALKQLSHITINGVNAVSETNCQIRIYNRGALLLPYGKESNAANGFHPLVVYDERNCEGNSCELYGLENSNGFMNTLTAAKFNNKIRSFTLKRGYMVTFSLRTGGYGYSRCFIADKADLVVNSLPTLMDKRISSYRIFRWQNTSKSGLASDTRKEAAAALNAISCYDWGTGVNLLPDVECVPNHIYEDYPSPSACGGVTYSCHMKTNNEPGNSADDHPQTVDEILNNWQNLMRTGLRLCSPSSHDGSLAHLRACLDSIDARGWRCDIIDLHCYWAESSFNTWSFYDQWANKYGRPIWISEWVWGASWNSNGAFANGVTEAQNRDAVKRITEQLNGWDCIERYFYWNSERDPSKIYKDGQLTPAGEYYASMNTGIGYCNYKNYIPKTPRFYTINDLTVDFNSRTGACKYTWTNKNYDLTDQTILQKKDGIKWIDLDTLNYTEALSRSFSKTIVPNENIGLNEFRLKCVDADNKIRYSNIVSFFIGGATSYGDIMAGRIESNTTDPSTIYFAKQSTAPVIITGIPTYKNTANGVINHVNTIGLENFKFNFDAWTEGKTMTFSNTESTDYIILQPGEYNWGEMLAKVDTCKYLSGETQSILSRGDTIEVFFKQPFEEGIKPIVLLQNVVSQTGFPTTPRLLEVTNKGFKMKLIRQSTITKLPAWQTTYYIAITPGSAELEGTGMRIHAGICSEKVGGVSYVSNIFRDEKGDTLFLHEPFILANSQTNNLEYPSVFRKNSDILTTMANAEGVEETVQYGIRVRRQMDPTVTIPTGGNNAEKNGDFIGWIAIDKAPQGINVGVLSPNACRDFVVNVEGRSIVPSDPKARIFNVNGLQVKAGVTLPAGIYVATNGKRSIKVLVR